jgi:protein DGCR14
MVKPTVLDEDEYTARLEAIIERDYFPHVRRDALKKALLEATAAGDAAAIVEIHQEMGRERLRRVGSRGGVIGTPSIGGSGTTASLATARGRGRGRGTENAASEATSWETETPVRESVREYGVEDEFAAGVGGRHDEKRRNTAYEEDRHLSVDGFLAKYTSEDNASFEDIMQRSEERRELKRRQLEVETAPLSKRLALEASTSMALVPRSSKASNGKERATIGHDSLFKVPTGVALSLKERAHMAIGAPKATTAKNTRFAIPPPLTADLSTRDGSTAKRYQRVHTPSMVPGVDMSPLMTWGEIASTPQRLADDSGNAVGKFTMKKASFREKKLRELTSKNASGSVTPTPRAQHRTPTPNGLSAAGKSLLRRVTPARRGTTPRDEDSQLRKSYSGTAAQRADATPRTKSRTGFAGTKGDLLRLD